MKGGTAEMENPQIDVSYVKQRLIDYREADKYIDNLIEMQERVEAQLTGIGSPSFSDMPKAGTNSSPDRFTNKIAKLDELKAKVNDRIEQREKERHYFEKLLSKIKKANQVSVIEMRYFYSMEWEEVCSSIFGSKSDYEYKADSYMRRTFYIHGEALSKLAELMAEFPE